MTKLAQQLGEAVQVRRQREVTQSGVAATMLGAMTHEVAAPQMLSLHHIAASRYQSRGRIDEAYMETLVDSIREEGLHDPIIVRPLPAQEGCHSMTPPRYELVAGHHRLEAFARLGRMEVPGFVRNLSDVEAARALTTENTNRKNLAHWELYKHMQMLRQAGAVKNNTELARVLNIARTAVPALDAFGLLPEAAQELLDDNPDLFGYNLAQKLKPYLPEHGMIVFDGLVLMAKGKVSQAALPDWVDQRVNPRQAKPRKEIALAGGVRLVVTEDGMRVSGNLDHDKLHRLIEDNLQLLLKSA